jgi:tetratricopeptide (TPR) repeat protein
VQKGLREYELGNFNEAKAFFQQAHQLSPNARTLRGLGMTSYELRRYVEAVDYFQHALDSSERPLTPQMRTEVTQLLSQARSFVTRLTLDVTPTHAQLRLDTREVARDRDGTILLDPGTHELVIEAPEHETVTRTIRSDGSEALTLAITLRSTRVLSPALANATAAPVELAPAQPIAASAAPEPLPAQPHSDSSVGPYIAIGASAVVVVAGGALLAVALSNKASVENPSASDSTGPRYQDYQSKADSVLPLSAAGITALALGAVGIAAGLTWKLMSDRERTPTAAFSASPGGLSLHGQF